jgi:hypothetical protein
MIMKKLVVLLCLLVAGSALAGIDPDPNSVGIFKDAAATTYEETAPLMYQPNTCYLVLSNPTTDGILGWECYITFDPGVGGFSSVTGWAPRGSFVNAGSPPDFAVGLATPIYGATEIVLMDITYFYTGGICTFKVGPGVVQTIPGSMAFLDGNDVGNALVMDPSSGDFDLPVYGVCSGCVVATEDATWGGVKSLYR